MFNQYPFTPSNLLFDLRAPIVPRSEPYALQRLGITKSFRCVLDLSNSAKMSWEHPPCRQGPHPKACH
jgi:hypothetical protein